MRLPNAGSGGKAREGWVDPDLHPGRVERRQEAGRSPAEAGA